MESLAGIGEKLIPLVRSPFLMRKVLPGLAATAIVFPSLGVRVDFFTDRLANLYRPALGLAALVLLLGHLTSFLSDDIYRIYEGRIFWPNWIFDFFQRLQQARVNALSRRADTAEKTNRTMRYRETWYILRRYPTNESGDPYASHPTLLGNILAGYESYPLTRYGMDAVFYWHRIWLQLENEKKEGIDSIWCAADGLLSLSAVGFCGALFWFLLGVSRFFGILSLLNRPTHPFLGGGLLLVLGYICYRLSLPLARANGEIFKSIFDLYRDRISMMTEIGPLEVDKWHGVWAYLQYRKVHCISCRKYYSAGQDRCPYCHFPSARSLSLGDRNCGREPTSDCKRQNSPLLQQEWAR